MAPPVSGNRASGRDSPHIPLQEAALIASRRCIPVQLELQATNRPGPFFGGGGEAVNKLARSKSRRISKTVFLNEAVKN